MTLIGNINVTVRENPEWHANDVYTEALRWISPPIDFDSDGRAAARVSARYLVE